MTFLLAISERSLGDRKLTEDSLIKESSRYRMYYKASFSLCLSLSPSLPVLTSAPLREKRKISDCSSADANSLFPLPRKEDYLPKFSDSFRIR